MEFLLEINTEEMPPSHVKAALSQLREGFEAAMSSSRIAVTELKVFGTCRRLVVLADCASGQADQEQVIIGPPKAVAFTAEGNPTPAALGFARSQKVEVGDLHIIQTAKGEYLGLKKTVKGKFASEVLTGVIPQIIVSLSFPKTMRWGEGAFRFSRPIKNILCLFGGDSLSFSFEGVVSGNTTAGHRIHAPSVIRAGSFKEYKETLAVNRVVIEEDERRQMILSQISEKLAPLKAKLHPDEDLLEKLTYDIECPYVFMGSFAEEYLALPLEVLSTAMREGQKLFSVVKDRKPLPLFLGVADNFRDPKDLIRTGNERVLKARLEDARFFWEQDLKIPLEKRAVGLKQVVFQEKLGSYDDKTQRLKKIAAYICDKLDEKEVRQEAVQAAELSKVDLLTEIVREFPALQGRVGGLYARKEGYSHLVCQAIYEHYQPLGVDDDSPASLPGAILSLADKIDSIVGVVGIGIEVSGSSDPLGLRRQAQGVCKVILDKKMSFSFTRLLEKAVAVYGEKLDKPKQDILTYCLGFFTGRLRYMYERRGFRYDIVNAALGPGIDDIHATFLRLCALDALKASPQFEPMILMAKRVNNILRDQPVFKINPELFAEKEERELHSTLSIIRRNAGPLLERGDFTKAQSIIFRIQSSLNAFFDRVLVMAEDKKTRQNRLALLQEISRLLLQVADYSQVVVEGQNSR